MRASKEQPPEGQPFPTSDPSGLTPGPSVFAGSLTNLIGLLGGSVFGWISGVVTARHIGAAGVGILAVAFGVTEFGRALSNFTHSPSILEYHRGKPAESVFGTSLVLKAVGTSLFVLIVILLSPSLGALLNVPAWAIPLGSTALLLGLFYEIGSARFEAEHRFTLRNILLAAGPMGGLAATLVLVALGKLTVFTSILTTLFAVSVMSIGFVFAWRAPWRLRLEKRIARYYLTYGSALVASTFLTQALIWTDTLMLAWLRGTSATGLYNVVFQITFVMVTASAAIGVALLPAMSRLAGGGHDTSAAYHRGTLLALALSLVLAAFYVVAGPWLLSLYGEAFAAGYPVLLILTIFGIAAAVSIPASTVLTVHGHAHTLTLIALGQAAANVVANYVLIQALGITGAAVATTSVFVCGTFVLWWFAHRVSGAWPLSRRTIGEARDVVRAWARRVRGR